MSTYRVATGHDIALASLTVLDPQPDEEHPGGFEYAEVLYAANGNVAGEGLHFKFYWSEMSSAQYTTILTAFGLHTAMQANVTVYVRDTLFGWVRMNGKALRPLPGRTVRWQHRPKDITIIVRDLVVSS